MTIVSPRVVPAAKFGGTVVRLLNATGKGRLAFRSHAVESLHVDFEGIIGNRHRGWTRGADARVPYLPRDTVMRNSRQLSLVSVEDCAEIARRLEIGAVDPATLGANVVASGIAHFSFLPRATRLLFPGGAILSIEDQNAPCSLAAEALQLANPDKPHIKPAFVKAATGLRGLVATVEHPGQITNGSAFTARLPQQWIYE